METISSVSTGTIPEHPILVPDVSVMDLDDGTIAIRQQDRRMILRGAAAQLVLRLIDVLDGKHTIAQLSEYAETDIYTVGQIVYRLINAQLVVNAETILNVDDPAFHTATIMDNLSPINTGRHTVYRHLQNYIIAVAGHPTLINTVCEQTHHSGIQKAIAWHNTDDVSLLETEKIAFIVHIERQADYQTSTRINTHALEHNIPWVTGWLEGNTIIISHVIIPNETACFECFIQRQRGNYPHFTIDNAYEQHLRTNKKTSLNEPQESLCVVDMALASLLALRSLSYLAGMRAYQIPTMTELSMHTFQSSLHPVLRLPYCPSCSPALHQPPTLPFADKQQ